jgi:hypothetical protein
LYLSCSLHVPHGLSVSSWLIFVTPDVGCTNPGRQVARATETCTVATNISWPSVWDLFHVTVQEPSIIRWFVRWGKFIHPCAK